MHINLTPTGEVDNLKTTLAIKTNLFGVEIMNKKVLLILTLGILVLSFLFSDLREHLSFENIKNKQVEFLAFKEMYPFKTGALFFTVYILVTALSLPGAAVLTLLGGALFGLIQGVFLISLASTIGATLAFLTSRYLFKDLIQQKFSDKLKLINEGVRAEGGFYLFTLRLVPLFPFFLINLVMGLTPIKVFTFFGVSLLGMLPGTIVYISAGAQLGKIKSLNDILSPVLLVSFAAIGLFPLIAKKAIAHFKN